MGYFGYIDFFLIRNRDFYGLFFGPWSWTRYVIIYRNLSRFPRTLNFIFDPSCRKEHPTKWYYPGWVDQRNWVFIRDQTCPKSSSCSTGKPYFCMWLSLDKSSATWLYECVRRYCRVPAGRGFRKTVLPPGCNTTRAFNPLVLTKRIQTDKPLKMKNTGQY